MIIMLIQLSLEESANVLVMSAIQIYRNAIWIRLYVMLATAAKMGRVMQNTE